MAMTKPVAAYDHFDQLDIRVGRIVEVEVANTKKPTYRIAIDFGPEIGRKVSCGAYRKYAREQLLGRLIIAIVNLGTKKMGPEVSEVLILGVPDGKDGTTYLTPESEVNLGVAVF